MRLRVLIANAIDLLRVLREVVPEIVGRGTDAEDMGGDVVHRKPDDGSADPQESQN